MVGLRRTATGSHERLSATDKRDAFADAVYKAIRGIPIGRVTSYGEVQTRGSRTATAYERYLTRDIFVRAQVILRNLLASPSIPDKLGRLCGSYHHDSLPPSSLKPQLPDLNEYRTRTLCRGTEYSMRRV